MSAGDTALPKVPGQDIDPEKVTHFIGGESVAATATRFFSLPPVRAFDVGTLVEI